MPYYFNNIMFPYPNMQQLNLDWIMQRVGETPTVINLPAASPITAVLGIIDDNIDDIPVGFSLLSLGNPAIDPIGSCGMLIMIKQDNTHFNFFGTHSSGAFLRGIRVGQNANSIYTSGPQPIPPTP